MKTDGPKDADVNLAAPIALVYSPYGPLERPAFSHKPLNARMGIPSSSPGSE